MLYLDNHTQDPDETLMKPKILCFKIVGKLFKALKQLISIGMFILVLICI